MPSSFNDGELILECSDQRWLQVMNKENEKEKIVRAINSAMKSNIIYQIKIRPSC